MDRHERELQRAYYSGEITEEEYIPQAIRFLKARGELPREEIGAIAVTTLGVLFYADEWRLIEAAPSERD